MSTSLSANQIDSFLAIILGFAVAGFVSAVYRAIRAEPASFHMLQSGGLSTAMAIPLLAFAGPAVLMRNTIRGRRFEKRKIHFVAIATVLASLWSMAIGYQVMPLFRGIVS